MSDKFVEEKSAPTQKRPGAMSIAGAFRISSGLAALDFLQTGSLATQTTKVKQLGATYAGRTNLFDLVHNFGVVGENTLHTLAEAHLANRKAALRTLLYRDHNTFKCLQALFFAFFNLYLHADGIAGGKRGKICTLE